MKKTFAIAAAVIAVAATASAAQARSNIGISINSGGYYGGPVYQPAPVYYQPAPVYYAPPPVVYQPYPYPYYSPAYRINYWNGPDWRGRRGHWKHGHGHRH